jgi:hypothetical protein
MDISRTHLRPLYFQFHVILARRLAVFPLFPAVTVPAIPHFLPAVQQHGTALRPAIQKLKKTDVLQHDNIRPIRRGICS